MKKKSTGRTSGSGSIEPIKLHSTLKTGYSPEHNTGTSGEKVDREKQEKFRASMGEAFKKIKEQKKEEAGKKELSSKDLKKMPKMIVPDLGPDFRHEVKFNSSEEGKMEMLRRFAEKNKKF